MRSAGNLSGADFKMAEIMKRHPEEEPMPKNDQVEHTMLSVRVPRDLLRELEHVAVEEDRTVAAEIRRMIRRHVEAFNGNTGGRMAA